MKKLLVIGNGSSLRDFDFEKIDRNKYDIMGLCLAFRYWNKNKWFPDYYCIGDSVVHKSNYYHINKLIKNENIKKCCFNQDSLFWEYDKKIMKHQNKIDVIQQMQKDKNSIFSLLNNYSTGSIAVLWGIHLGYTEIEIIGVDNDYIEILPETEVRKDGTLTIVKEIKNNPNYFFDSYQMEGDVYNKPNGDSVHLTSWKELSQNIIIHNKNFNKNIKVTNYNYKKSISDFIETKDLSQFLFS